MSTIAKRDEELSEVTQVFGAIRQILVERDLELESPMRSTDGPIADDIVVGALIAAARKQGLTDGDAILAELITTARQVEVRAIGDRIAILGFEKHRQQLILTSEPEELGL